MSASSAAGARPAFHLAFPVDDLAAARRFYVDVLGCGVGRSSEHWIDFDLAGHQVVAHLDPERCVPDGAGPVDGDAVPTRHFGLILEWTAWERLAERLRAHAVPFVIEPRVRWVGRPGEQGTFFVRDPAGNALEFKTFRDPQAVFARWDQPGG